MDFNQSWFGSYSPFTYSRNFYPRRRRVVNPWFDYNTDEENGFRTELARKKCKCDRCRYVEYMNSNLALNSMVNRRRGCFPTPKNAASNNNDGPVKQNNCTDESDTDGENVIDGDEFNPSETQARSLNDASESVPNNDRTRNDEEQRNDTSVKSNEHSDAESCEAENDNISEMEDLNVGSDSEAKPLDERLETVESSNIEEDQEASECASNSLSDDMELSGEGDESNTNEDPKNPENEVEKKLQLIDSVKEKVNDLALSVDNFAEHVKNKDYLRCEEMLTKCLLELDGILTEGEEKIRAARRSVVKLINENIAKLEGKVNDS